MGNLKEDATWKILAGNFLTSCFLKKHSALWSWLSIGYVTSGGRNTVWGIEEGCKRKLSWPILRYFHIFLVRQKNYKWISSQDSLSLAIKFRWRNKPGYHVPCIRNLWKKSCVIMYEFPTGMWIPEICWKYNLVSFWWWHNGPYD
jgi:hypothetical protein